MTERLHFHFSLSCIGEGNGNPLQSWHWGGNGAGVAGLVNQGRAAFPWPRHDTPSHGGCPGCHFRDAGHELRPGKGRFVPGSLISTKPSKKGVGWAHLARQEVDLHHSVVLAV